MNTDLIQGNNGENGKISVNLREGSMAFGGHQSLTPASDGFVSQAPSNGDKARVPQPFSSSNPLSNFSSSWPGTSWAAQNDPCHMMDFVQSNANNRNGGHGNGCGSDSDLYGLVSDILEDTSEKDNNFADMTPSKLASVWSPNSVKEGSQQYPQSGSQVQPVSPLVQTPVYHSLCSRSHGQIENTVSQQGNQQQQHFNDFGYSDQWLFPPTSRGSDSCPLQNEDVQTATGFLLSSNPGKPDYNAAGKGDGFYSVNYFSDNLDWSARSGYLPDRMIDEFFKPYGDDSDHKQEKPSRNGQFSVEEASTLAANMQGLLLTTNGDYSSEFQDKLLAQRCYEDHVSDQNNFGYSKIQILENREQRFKKQLGEDFEDFKTPGSTVKMQSQPGAFYFLEHDQRGAGYFPQPNVLAETFSLPSPFPDKHAMQMANNAMGYVMEYASQCSPWVQYLHQPRQEKGISNISPPKVLSDASVSEFFPPDLHPMQRRPDHLTVHMLGDGQNLYGRTTESLPELNLEKFINTGGDSKFELEPGNPTLHSSPVAKVHSAQHFEGKMKLPTGNLSGGDNKQGFLHNPYLSRSSHGFQRQGRASRVNAQGKIQAPPFLPYLCSMGDSRHTPNKLQLNSGDLPSRSTFSFSNAAQPVGRCDLVPGSDPASFNPYSLDAAGRAVMLDGVPPPLTAPLVMKKHGSPTTRLQCYLEKCRKQLTLLEEERKKAESILVRNFPGKQISVVSNSHFPKVPANPSRVDRLVVDQLREQTKVASLLRNIEHLRSFPLHANIYSALERHLDAVHTVQAQRKEECVSAVIRQRKGALCVREDRDALLLYAALKDLFRCTRKSRTALWCALEMTLPKTASASVEERRGTES
ncbi:meiosis-specific coiled-coil domain-containing protein MEIOC isoform X2 [Arapaima gigas]